LESCYSPQHILENKGDIVLTEGAHQISGNNVCDYPQKEYEEPRHLVPMFPDLRLDIIASILQALIYGHLSVPPCHIMQVGIGEYLKDNLIKRHHEDVAEYCK